MIKNKFMEVAFDASEFFWLVRNGAWVVKLYHTDDLPFLVLITDWYDALYFVFRLGSLYVFADEGQFTKS